MTSTIPTPTPPDETSHARPCHTGPAAHTCGFDVALHEVDVDTAELLAVTR